MYRLYLTEIWFQVSTFATRTWKTRLLNWSPIRSKRNSTLTLSRECGKRRTTRSISTNLNFFFTELVKPFIQTIFSCLLLFSVSIYRIGCFETSENLKNIFLPFCLQGFTLLNFKNSTFDDESWYKTFINCNKRCFTTIVSVSLLYKSNIWENWKLLELWLKFYHFMNSYFLFN